MSNTIPNNLYFNGYKFELVSCKHNILTFKRNKVYYYDDDIDDASILIIEYHPEKHERNGRYYVISDVIIDKYGIISGMKITGNRLAYENEGEY